MVLTRNATKKLFLENSYFRMMILIRELLFFDPLEKNETHFTKVKMQIVILENRIWEKTKINPSSSQALLHDIITRLIIEARAPYYISPVRQELTNSWYDAVVNCCESELQIMNSFPLPVQLPLQ